MHKCHNYHAILHKLYMWFGKNELRLYLNGAKISSIGGGAAPRPPSKYAHDSGSLLDAIRHKFSIERKANVPTSEHNC